MINVKKSLDKEETLDIINEKDQKNFGYFKNECNVKVSLIMIPKHFKFLIKKEIFNPTQDQIDSEKIFPNLKHKNICECYKFIENQKEKKLILYMEYLNKGTLKNIIEQLHSKKEKRSQKYLMLISGFIAVEILKGLKYLKDKKISHRDIKPSNICVNKLGEVKITDFGISKKFKNTDETLMTLTGTELFLAPEMLLNGKYKGDKVDVWALGILIYIFVYGHHPFLADLKFVNDHIQTDIYFRLSKENKKIPKRGNDDFNLWLQSMLEFDESRRNSIEDLLKHPFVKKRVIKDSNLKGELINFLGPFKESTKKHTYY